MSGTTEALLEKQADIVIGSTVSVGFRGNPLGSVKMIPVAAPDHPLFSKPTIEEFELKSYRQVVLRDSGQHRQVDAGWLKAEQRWTVSHFSSSVSLVKTGLAFAFLPMNWIKQELEQGSLREIAIVGDYVRTIPIYLMFSAIETAGPATKALAATLTSDFAA